MLSLCSCIPGKAPGLELLEAFPNLDFSDSALIELELPVSQRAMVIEVQGAGTNYASQIVTAGGRLLSDIHFTYLRSVPHFHHVDPSPAKGPLLLRLQPFQTRPNAKVSVYVLSVPDAAENLNKAWQELASGQQRVNDMEKSGWALRVAALQESRRQFESAGVPEQALWATYLAAYIKYFPLYDYPGAAEDAGSLLGKIDALKGRNPEPDSLKVLQVLTHQLAGQILLESDARQSPENGENGPERARRHFTIARDLAEATGLPFEYIWAANNLGIAYFYESELERALEQYTIALEQARMLKDNYLLNLIGSNMAVAHEKMGHILEAVTTLEKIQQQNSVQDNLLDQEYNLSLLGSYYLKLYRFPDALDALNRAMELSNALKSSENRGRNNVLLGRVYREMGQADKARTLATLSIADLQEADDRRGQRHARRLLADVARLHGDFEEMGKQRALEHQLLAGESDKAAWLFSKAEDFEEEGLWLKASEHFRQSSTAYRDSGLQSWADLATVRACAASISLPQTPDCTVDLLAPLAKATEQLQASGPALQARYAWVRLLDAQGHQAEALGLAGELVTDIQFYRSELPGVLGAWYWDAREEIFTFYLNLILKSADQQAQGNPRTFLALDRLRNSNASSLARLRTEEFTPPSGAADPADSEPLRELLARRDLEPPTPELIEIQRHIDSELASVKIRSQPRQLTVSSLNLEQFRQQLTSLPEDWSLLSYYLGGQTALAWVGTREGLEAFELGPSAPILRRIEKVKSRLRVYNEPMLNTELAALGGELLGPLRTSLGFNVLIASGGVLADFPIETLLIDGREFIQTHQVTNIQSASEILQVVDHVKSRVEPVSLFLGGYSPGGTTEMPALPGSGQELDAIRAAFANKDVVFHSPQNLGLSDFHSAAFQEADIIHLASHAMIDRDYPELSRLALPGSAPGVPQFLLPADLVGLSPSAKLIVLSACETAGLNRFDFDSQLGFVSQLLYQSDAAVIASLWPVSDRVTSQLMSAFYTLLAAGNNAALALRLAKLQQLEQTGSTDRNWAAFQLFSR